MYVGTLNQIAVDPTAKILIESTTTQFCYLLEQDAISNNPNAIQHFIANVKRICLTKPKNWLKSMLQKLNQLAMKINVYEESKPGERSIWSKIKASISSLILSITSRLNSLLGGKTNKDERNIYNQKNANEITGYIKNWLNDIKDSKQKTMHTILNKNWGSTMRGIQSNEFADDTDAAIDASRNNTRSWVLRNRLVDKYSKQNHKVPTYK